MTSIGSLGNEDQFGKLIADSTKNKADLAAHHDFSAERWRYFRRDATTGSLSREFVQYGNTTGFTDNVDSLTIDPTSADYIAQMETAERFKYAVGYTKEISFAFQTNQALAAGDSVVVGYGDPDLENGMASADGWFMEFDPSLNNDQCYFNEYRNGTVVSNGGSNTVVDFEKAITDWRRLAIEFNWYGVGSAKLKETFTDSDGKQKNVVQEEIAAGDGKGSQTANKRVKLGILSGGNGTTLEIGSLGVIVNGDVDEILRQKNTRFEYQINKANTWIPAFAIRRDPTHVPVSITLANQIPVRHTSNEVEVLVKNFDSSKVDFSGGSWSTPDALTPQNTALETRGSLSGVADRTGAVVSDTTTPGGYAVSRAEFSSSSDRLKTTAGNAKVKRKIYDGDVGVFLVRSPSTGETVTVGLSINERW